MALLELGAVNDRLIELEGTVAKHAAQASNALRALQALIEEVQIETKRLGDAVLALGGVDQNLERYIDRKVARIDEESAELAAVLNTRIDETRHHAEILSDDTRVEIESLRSELTR